MINPHCKIGKVRMKDKKIAALPIRPRTKKEQELLSCIDDVATWLEGNISGYVVCAWDQSGSPVLLWDNDNIGVPTMVMPQFVEACARQVIAGWVFDP